MKAWLYRLRLKYVTWLYREVPDDVCCCGDDMNAPHWENHSPKSMQAWAIQCHERRMDEERARLVAMVKSPIAKAIVGLHGRKARNKDNI